MDDILICTLEENLRIAVEALEFYADEGNWWASNGIGNRNTFDVYGYENLKKFGGQAAEDALKLLK